MMLLRRIARRGKRILGEAADGPLRRSLRSQPRPPRAVVPMDDLPDHAGLVVTAHPDDEVIAAGVMLSRLKRAGVICVTNGAPHNVQHAIAAGFDNRWDYGEARQKEADAALALTGREIAPSSNIGISDQEATLYLVPTTLYLAHRLRLGFDRVITHAYEGGHPDHDTTAFCVHAACALIAKAGETPPVIVEAPLYNAPGGTFQSNQFLPHDDAGPVAHFKLSPAEQALKRRMFDCHVTQSKILAQFDVTEEKFRQAPRYHFAAAPHPGKLGFDSFGWFLNGRKWRTLAWRAMRELDLRRELA